MEKQHDNAIDLIKFIAVLFITNSHFLPLYKDINPALATFGVHGNALFFFASGLTIAKSDSVVKLDFFNWYKRRIGRIWPVLIVNSLLVNILQLGGVNWKMQLLGEGYWFLQFILLAYVIVYFLLRQLREYLSVMLILSVVATWGGIILSPWTEQSVWHEFHWFCYSSVLILGMICGKKKNIIKSNWWMTLLCFIFYFILMAFGKGKSGGIYYIQLVALIPLLGFVYNLYFWINKWIAIVIERKWLYRPIYWLGSLCLEIYVVQHVIITDRFNCLFPLNVIIVFLLIFGAAYALRIFTNFFNQTLAKESYNWKKMITI